MEGFSQSVCGRLMDWHDMMGNIRGRTAVEPYFWSGERVDVWLIGHKAKHNAFSH